MWYAQGFDPNRYPALHQALLTAGGSSLIRRFTGDYDPVKEGEVDLGELEEVRLIPSEAELGRDTYLILLVDTVGDDSGTLRRRANFEAISDELEDQLGHEVLELTGPNGTYGLVVMADAAHPKVLDVVLGTNEDRVYDDRLLFELHDEAEDKAWDQGLRLEFLEAMRAAFGRMEERARNAPPAPGLTGMHDIDEREARAMQALADWAETARGGPLECPLQGPQCYDIAAQLLEDGRYQAGLDWEEDPGGTMSIDVRRAARSVETREALATVLRLGRAFEPRIGDPKSDATEQARLTAFTWVLSEELRIRRLLSRMLGQDLEYEPNELRALLAWLWWQGFQSELSPVAFDEESALEAVRAQRGLRHLDLDRLLDSLEERGAEEEAQLAELSDRWLAAKNFLDGLEEAVANSLVSVSPDEMEGPTPESIASSLDQLGAELKRGYETDPEGRHRRGPWVDMPLPNPRRGG